MYIKVVNEPKFSFILYPVLATTAEPLKLQSEPNITQSSTTMAADAMTLPSGETRHRGLSCFVVVKTIQKNNISQNMHRLLVRTQACCLRVSVNCSNFLVKNLDDALRSLLGPMEMFMLVLQFAFLRHVSKNFHPLPLLQPNKISFKKDP